MHITQHSMQAMTSSNTVSQRISDMALDVLKQFLHRIQGSEIYALQLDESTDVAGLAQLLVYVCYSWMSQQTWLAWHSSWYMSLTCMGFNY